jgi:hypothetical protein
MLQSISAAAEGKLEGALAARPAVARISVPVLTLRCVTCHGGHQQLALTLFVTSKKLPAVN